MNQATLTIETVKSALEQNRARLQAVNPKGGADIDAMLSEKGKYSVSPFTIEKINAMGFAEHAKGIFSGNMNPKVQKRFVQCVNALNTANRGRVETGNINDFDRCTAIVLLALDAVTANTLNTDALLYLGTGAKGGEVNTKGANRSRIRAKLGQLGLSTMLTQVSRTTGKSGFLRYIDAVKGDVKGSNLEVTLNRSNPFIVEFFNMFDGQTVAQVEAFVEGATK